MSVLIEGMKKPDNCDICPYAFCHLVNDCPIIDVPTPYGRLIDADALRFEIEKYFAGLPIQGHYDMLKLVDEAPTIIEAEEGQP